MRVLDRTSNLRGEVTSSPFKYVCPPLRLPAAAFDWPQKPLSIAQRAIPAPFLALDGVLQVTHLQGIEHHPGEKSLCAPSTGAKDGVPERNKRVPNECTETGDWADEAKRTEVTGKRITDKRKRAHEMVRDAGDGSARRAPIPGVSVSNPPSREGDASFFFSGISETIASVVSISARDRRGVLQRRAGTDLGSGR